MVTNRIQMTKNGIDNMKDELVKLKGKLPLVIKRVAEARAQGDLKENSEYAYAREDLDFLQRRISEVEEILTRARVVSNGKTGKVVLGSSVVVSLDGKTETYVIVSELEADPMKSRISDKSPLGLALLRKKEGDRVKVDLPSGEVEYRVVKVK